MERNLTDAFYRKKTSQDVFREKTTIVSELLSQDDEQPSSHHFNMEDFERPKLIRRHKPGSGNIWRIPHPALRQLSSLTKITSAPKYYPLGLWQHQQNNGLPRIQKLGILTARVSPDESSTHSPKQTSSIKRANNNTRNSQKGLKEGKGLPPLTRTKSLSYDHKNQTEPPLLKQSIVRGYTQLPGSLDEFGDVDEPEEPSFVPPWERKINIIGYDNQRQHHSPKSERDNMFPDLEIQLNEDNFTSSIEIGAEQSHISLSSVHLTSAEKVEKAKPSSSRGSSGHKKPPLLRRKGVDRLLDNDNGKVDQSDASKEDADLSDITGDKDNNSVTQSDHGSSLQESVASVTKNDLSAFGEPNASPGSDIPQQHEKLETDDFLLLALHGLASEIVKNVTDDVIGKLNRKLHICGIAHTEAGQNSRGEPLDAIIIDSQT